MCMYICMYAYTKCLTCRGIGRKTLFTHLAPVACLAGAIRDALLPGARLLLLLLLVLLLCRMLLVMRVVVLVLELVLVLVLFLVLLLLLLLQVVSRGLHCRHMMQLGTRAAIVVVVHGSLDRHGGSARLVVLRRLLSQKSSVFSVSLSRVLSSPRQWRQAG